MTLTTLSVVARSCVSRLSSRASAVSKDGAVVICWHPKQDIPYENTKPITRGARSLKGPFTPIRVQFDHSSNPTIKDVADALCRSARTLRPNRSERAFSPYYWDNEILRRRL